MRNKALVVALIDIRMLQLNSGWPTICYNREKLFMKIKFNPGIIRCREYFTCYFA